MRVERLVDHHTWWNQQTANREIETAYALSEAWSNVVPLEIMFLRTQSCVAQGNRCAQLFTKSIGLLHLRRRQSSFKGTPLLFPQYPKTLRKSIACRRTS